MKKTQGFLALLAAATLATAALTSAAPPTAGEDRESHDLAQLRDGETRTFGEGAHAVVASRAGEVVTMVVNGPEERSISCTVGRDDCFVTTMDGAHHTLLFVGDQSREPGGDAFAWSHAGGGGADPGEARVKVIQLRGGGGGGDDVRIMRLPGGEAGADMKVLSCPRGDTTMMVKKDDAVTSYVCPQHNVRLEEAEGGNRVMRRIVVERHVDGDDAAKQGSAR